MTRTILTETIEIAVPAGLARCYTEGTREEREKVDLMVRSALTEVFLDDYETEEEENEAWSQMGLYSMAEIMDRDDEPDIYSMDDVIKIPRDNDLKKSKT